MALIPRFSSNQSSENGSPHSIFQTETFPPRGPQTLRTALAATAIVAAVYVFVAVATAFLQADPSQPDTANYPLVPLFALLITGVSVTIALMLWRERQQWKRRLGQLNKLAGVSMPLDGLTTWTSRQHWQALERRVGEMASLSDQLGGLLLDRDRQLAALRQQAGLVYWETDLNERYSRIELASAVQRDELAQLLGKHRWDDDAQLVVASSPDWASWRAEQQRQHRFDPVIVRRTALNGETFDVWETGEPRYAADGQLIGYRGVMIDLDRAPVARLLRQDASAELAAVQDTRRELETFASAISHDLRAPLRSVDGFTRIVKEDYGAQLDHTAHEHLGRILGAASRMDAMIESLLTLARLSVNTLQTVDVDLSRLATEVIEELRVHERLDAPAGDPLRTKTLQIDIAAGLRERGDPLLLRLLMQNLLGNAWKYSSRQPRPAISLSCELQGRQRVYCVADNGVGFDMQHAKRLFGPFQRLHTASDFPGTGIGLASAQRIVRQHEGRIWAQAAPGQGARFYFTLWERRRPSSN